MKNLPQIYCDMDGVLCDFKSYAEKIVGVPIAKWMNLSKIDKWKPIVDKRNLGISNDRINLVRRFQKKDYAQTGYRTPAILIDDYEKNSREFTARGGIGIHHTSTSNTIRQLKKLGY